MSNAAVELKTFLLKGKDEPSFLQSQIKRYGVGNILLNDVKNLDLLDYCDCCDRVILQRIRDILFEEEIYKLIDASSLKGLKLIFLKGIFLSEDLYQPKEIRESYDIDLIVDFKDIGKSFEVLAECGYKKAYYNDPFENDTNLAEPNQEDLTLLSHKHIEFVKDVEFLNCNIPVMVELHINFASPDYLQIDRNPILSRTVKIESKRHDVWLLELHDRLIFLFVHYIENFSENIARVLMGRNIQIPKMQLLHDMALFIDKYSGILSWDTILNRTKEWGISNRLILLFKLIEKIYPNRVPDSVITRLSNNKEESFQEALFIKLLEVDEEDIIFKDLKLVLSSIFSLDMLKGQDLLCKFSQDATIYKGQAEIVIDEHYKNMPKDCRTYLSSGMKPESSLECSARGWISWNMDAFNITMRVYDNSLVFAESSTDFSIMAQDGIEVIFLTDAVSIHQFALIPTKLNNKVIVNVVYCKDKSFLSSDSYSYRINIFDDGYEICASLPWNHLGIEVHTGLVLGFDIAINNCESPLSPRKTRLSLSSGGTDWYNITSYSKICLTM